MKSDEILAERLEKWDCPDDILLDECLGREGVDACTQCWLDWARKEAKKSESTKPNI